MSLNPEAIETYRNRGIVCEGLGQLERAIDDYSRVLALRPGMAEVYVDRGKLYQ